MMYLLRCIIPEVCKLVALVPLRSTHSVPSIICDVPTHPHHGRHEPDTQLSGIYSNLFHIYERIYNKSSRRIFFLADYQRSSGGQMS